MKRFLCLGLLISIFWTVNLFAQGEIIGTIDSQGEFKALEISLMKFQTRHKWPQEESLASQISEVIDKDLTFSLFFEFLEENLFSFSDPADLSPLDQDIWLRTEAQFVLAGKVESQTSTLKIDIYLY